MIGISSSESETAKIQDPLAAAAAAAAAAATAAGGLVSRVSTVTDTPPSNCSE